MGRVTFILLAILVFSGSGGAKDKKKKFPEDIGVSDPGKGVNLYSQKREARLGKGMSLQVECESRLAYDPVVTEFVNRLGQNLVRNSDARTPFIIKVIDSEDVNAFALPGGYLYVNSGLITAAANEAELAGVLAHEIAHVAARHLAKQATRADLLDYGTLPLVFFGGLAGLAAHEAATAAGSAGLLSFSRGMEAQADRLGIAYMYRAGYDPNAFVDFLERIQTRERQDQGPARTLASHPQTIRRIKAAQEEIENGLEARPQYVLDTSEFQQVRERLLAVGKRRSNGLIVSITPQLQRRGTTAVPDGRPVVKR
jgi:beta-barrel assembly-enhancing protease